MDWNLSEMWTLELAGSASGWRGHVVRANPLLQSFRAYQRFWGLHFCAKVLIYCCLFYWCLNIHLRISADCGRHKFFADFLFFQISCKSFFGQSFWCFVPRESVLATCIVDSDCVDCWIEMERHCQHLLSTPSCLCMGGLQVSVLLHVFDTGCYHFHTPVSDQKATYRWAHCPLPQPHDAHCPS